MTTSCRVVPTLLKEFANTKHPSAYVSLVDNVTNASLAPETEQKTKFVKMLSSKFKIKSCTTDFRKYCHQIPSLILGGLYECKQELSRTVGCSPNLHSFERDYSYKYDYKEKNSR